MIRTLRLALCLAFSVAWMRAAEPQPTVMESDSLEMKSTENETVAVLKGNVTVTGTNLRITCDYMEVVASRMGELTAVVAKLDQFKSLIATGRVHITQGDREVTCGRAEVYPREEKVILTESPVVIDKSGPYQATGTRIILLRGERRLFGENIRMTGPEIKDLGFDTNAPMKAPAPAPAAPRTP